MEVALIIILVLIFIVLAVFIIRNNFQKIEKIRYLAAAGNILREDFLNYSLENPFLSDTSQKEPRGQKMMIYLRAKNDKNSRFVFDPEKGISLGRDKYNSNVYLNDITVSQNHCMIYSIDDHVFIRDCNSSNGTAVMRGAFQRYSLAAGSEMELMTGDKKVIGGTTFSVTLFYYDILTM